MVLYEMGIDAVSPSSETTFIPDEMLDELKKKYNNILILYDRDKTGMMKARDHHYDDVVVNYIIDYCSKFDTILYQRGTDSLASTLRES